MIKNVAVIGLGSISQRHRHNIKSLYPNSIITTFSASGKEPSTKIENSDEFIRDINELAKKNFDLAIIASPSPFHLEHAQIFIEKNIAVFVEKPITSEYKDSQELLKLIEQYGSPIHTGYCLRYLSSTIEIKKYLEENIIGQIYNVNVNVGQYLPDWRVGTNYKDSVSANKKLGGGALLELSHELDYLRMLVGPLEFKFGYLRSNVEIDLDVEEIADVVLINKTGVLCNVHLDFLQKIPQRVCSFIGSEGRLDWNIIENKISIYSKNNTKTLFSEPNWDKNLMYVNMIKDFVNQIKDNKFNSHSLIESIETIKLIEEIKKESIWSNKNDL